MEGELSNFTKIWLTAALSGCYCFALSKHTQKGLLRLLLVLPVIIFFAAAPYSLVTCSFTATTWFFLTWLGISKLLLFSFDVGPLAAQRDLSLPHFVCTLLLPIKSSGSGPVNAPQSSLFWRWALLGAKILGFWGMIEAYTLYKEAIPFWGILGLFCCHLYLRHDIILAICGAFARATLGLELASQAHKPYFTSSLQDFWGKRWNLMASDVLRQTAYDPIRRLATPFIGRKMAIYVGVFTSFLVSGFMHEWEFSILTRTAPTWKVTWFFVIHGVCVVIEMMIKMETGNKWKMHRAVSWSLTVGFGVLTGAWLFFPSLLRNNLHEKVLDEYTVLGSFLKKKVLYLFRHQ